MAKVKDLADNALAKMAVRITDEVFLIIQNDPELMHEYLRAVEESGLDTVNQQIGKAVKTRFDLTNDDVREKNPRSTLIRSHQMFK
jgi:hypothetical protein